MLFPNSRGIKAAANLRLTSTDSVQLQENELMNKIKNAGTPAESRAAPGMEGRQSIQSMIIDSERQYQSMIVSSQVHTMMRSIAGSRVANG